MPAETFAPTLDAEVRPNRAGFALALVVLFASVLLVLLSWRWARERELRSAEVEFRAATDGVVTLIQQRLVNYELTVRGGVAMFAAVARPSAAQWKTFVDGLELPQRFPAIAGLGYAPYLSASALETLQLETRAAGRGLLTVWPRGVREHYGPVMYLEPKTGENIAAMGYDMYADPARRAAMDAARDSGEPRLTERVQLLRDSGGDVAGLLLYAPVYRAGDAPREVQSRRRSLQGWVVAPFRMPRFIEVALQPIPRDVRFRLLDVTDTVPRLLHVDPGFGNGGRHAFARSVSTEQYGRRWRYDFVSGPPAVAMQGVRGLQNTLAVGLFASLLLFGIAWTLARTEARAQRIATRMTEAHRRSEARVLALNRSLEARVAARTRELSEANRELETFAYSVSHDLRAPLRAIEGFSRLLEERHAAALDETGRDYLQRVRRAGTRMGGLIEALLKLARFGRGELDLQPLDLGAIAADIADELRAGEPGRSVTLDIAPGLHAIGDLALVQSLLQNLLGNAWKFTRGREDARIAFGRGDAGEFFVRDNGVGFDQQEAGRLFRPFQRLHGEEAFAGDGIGLASVKRIVERHGGSVRVEARAGEGATFWFSLGARQE